MLIQFPLTVPNPALEVVLTHKGWVDFGNGVVPPEVAADLGIRLVMANDLFLDGVTSGRLPGDISLSHSFIKRMEAAVLGPHMRPGRSHRTPGPPKSAGSGAPLLPPGVAVDSRGMLVSQFRMSRRQIQSLREARGLGRAAAAAAAAKLSPHQRISPRVLETIEAGGRLTDGHFTISRLDMAYGADGHLGIERTFISRPSAVDRVGRRVILPDFWHGPVWLQFSGPGPAETALVRLLWSGWRRECYVESGTVITSRRAPAVTAPPLLVRLPAGWIVGAGTGVVPGATDISHGWHTATPRVARTVIRDISHAAGL